MASGLSGAFTLLMRALAMVPAQVREIALSVDLQEREAALPRSAKVHVALAHIGACAVPVGHLTEPPDKASVWDEEAAEIHHADPLARRDDEMVADRNMDLFHLKFSSKGASSRYRAPGVRCSMKAFNAGWSRFLGLEMPKSDLWPRKRRLARAGDLPASWRLAG